MSTNGLFSLHEAVGASRTLRPDQKNPPEECGGQGGVDSSIGQGRPVRFDKWESKSDRNLANSDDAASRVYALGKFLEGKLLRGRQTFLRGRFGTFAARSRRCLAFPKS